MQTRHGKVAGRSRSVRLAGSVARLGVLVLAAAAAVIMPGGCTTNPTTGRSQFLTMSREEEIKLGTEAAPGLTSEFGGKVPDGRLQDYVSNIGRQLAAVTEADNPTLPWEFTLLDSGVINAFALPGGKVFVSRGLAEEMTNEAQLAAVLGHEIGHVTARHSNERYGQAIGTTIGGAIIGAVIGGVASGKASGAGVGAAAGATVGGVAGLAFSRDQEIEADRLGMRYMSAINYDPVGAIEVQQILQRAAGKGSRPPEFLSTHPSSETRIRALNERLDKYYAHTRNNPQFQKFEERFQRDFLTPLKRLPPPKQARGTGSTRDMLAHAALGALGDPVLWCAHCRAAVE
jgi:predicted Zn-dependent protease